MEQRTEEDDDVYGTEEENEKENNCYFLDFNVHELRWFISR